MYRQLEGWLRREMSAAKLRELQALLASLPALRLSLDVPAKPMPPGRAGPYVGWGGCSLSPVYAMV